MPVIYLEEFAARVVLTPPMVNIMPNLGNSHCSRKTIITTFSQPIGPSAIHLNHYGGVRIVMDNRQNVSQKIATSESALKSDDTLNTILSSSPDLELWNKIHHRKTPTINTESTEYLPSSDKLIPENGKSVLGIISQQIGKLYQKFNDRWRSKKKEINDAPSPATSSPAISKNGYWYVLWLTIVAVAYLYNCWAIPLRNAFPYQTPENTPTWLFWDYFMDFIYLIDLLVVKPRVKYLEDGFWIQDPRLTRQNYVEKFQYKMDVLSLLPLDLLYFIYGTSCSYFRIPRLLKIQSFCEFFNHLDNFTSSPYAIRVARTLVYMIYLVHLNTCAYYAVSVYEGLGSNKWVYNGQGNAYIRCFYRAIKTLTSIGKNPKPSNEIEYLFITISWLIGIFVFAILICQIALGSCHNEGMYTPKVQLDCNDNVRNNSIQDTTTTTTTTTTTGTQESFDRILIY